MIDFNDLPQLAPDFKLEDLFEVGMHFGHPKRKWHPKMEQFIYMEKNGVHIFDLEKTAKQLKWAYNVLHQLGIQGKKVVIVGTKRQAKEIIETAAKQAGLMYITSRWLGGMLTNWTQVKKSLERMLDLEAKLEAGAFKGFTKYEVVRIEKELNRLRRFFEGLRELKQLPDCLVVLDPTREDNVIKEANSVGVPVIALIDSNGDPSLVDLPVPANDDAAKSIQFFMQVIADGYAAGKAKGKTAEKAVVQDQIKKVGEKSEKKENIDKKERKNVD